MKQYFVVRDDVVKLKPKHVVTIDMSYDVVEKIAKLIEPEFPRMSIFLRGAIGLSSTNKVMKK